MTDYPTDYESLGWKLKYEEKFEEAVQAFDNAIYLEQNLYFALHGKGECLLELGRYDEALVEFQKAIEVDYWHSWAYHGAGRAYFHQHHYEIAREYFDKAIEREEGSVFGWYWKGRTLIELHQLNEATETLRTALRCATDDRQDMLPEIEKTLTSLVEYKDALEKENEALRRENAQLKEQLRRTHPVVVHGDFVQGTNIKDDAVVNRSHLGE